MRKPVYSTFMMILSAALITVSVSCQAKFKDSEYKDRRFPDFVIQDFRYISSDYIGRKEWELKSTVSKMYNDKNEVFLYNMTMSFFNAEGGIKTYLSANSGFFNRDNLNIFAEGNVVIESDKEMTLEANTVYWNDESGEFYTEPGERVILRQPGLSLFCENFRADAGFEEISYENSEAIIDESMYE